MERITTGLMIPRVLYLWIVFTETPSAAARSPVEISGCVGTSGAYPRVAPCLRRSTCDYESIRETTTGDVWPRVSTSGYPMSVTNPLIDLIESDPGMAQRLLSAHGQDASGHCKSCSGGAQTGRFIWPCSLHTAATAAIRNGSRRPAEPVLTKEV